jgi:hypothetical protein
VVKKTMETIIVVHLSDADMALIMKGKGIQIQTEYGATIIIRHTKRSVID